MKGATTAVTCLLVLAAASVVAGVLQLAIIVFLIWGALFRTRETLSFLGLMGIIALIGSHPLVAGAAAAAVITATLAGDRRVHTRKLPRLFEPRGTDRDI